MKTKTKPIPYAKFHDLILMGELSQMLCNGRTWTFSVCVTGEYIFCRSLPDNIGISAGDMYEYYVRGKSIFIN